MSDHVLVVVVLGLPIVPVVHYGISLPVAPISTTRIGITEDEVGVLVFKVGVRFFEDEVFLRGLVYRGAEMFDCMFSIVRQIYRFHIFHVVS